MDPDREKRQKAGKALGICVSIYAIVFAVIWCVIVAAMGAWFMLIFGVPMVAFLVFRLAFLLKQSKSRQQKEPWEQPDKSQKSSGSTVRRDGLCPYCGRPLSEDFTFCPACGRRL